VPHTLELANTDTLVLVVVAGVLELVVLFPVARWLRGQQRRASGIPSGEVLAS